MVDNTDNRAGEPDEVGTAAFYLLSDEAPYDVTGVKPSTSSQPTQVNAGGPVLAPPRMTAASCC